MGCCTHSPHPGQKDSASSALFGQAIDLVQLSHWTLQARLKPPKACSKSVDRPLVRSTITFPGQCHHLCSVPSALAGNMALGFLPLTQRQGDLLLRVFDSVIKSGSCADERPSSPRCCQLRMPNSACLAPPGGRHSTATDWPQSF